MTHSGTSARPGETVAVLGAGGMLGFAMARNIARAEIGVRAWDRTRGKAESLAADGAYIADTRPTPPPGPAAPRASARSASSGPRPPSTTPSIT